MSLRSRPASASQKAVAASTVTPPASRPQKSPPRGPAELAVWAFLKRHTVPSPFAVALSGGADSTALLLALSRWCAVHADQSKPATGPLRVFHVHHGLQKAADAFEAHCRSTCEQLSSTTPIEFEAVRVNARHMHGQSPEAAARDSRYAALVKLCKLHGVGTLFTGHHADDQAETVMLALSRGTGVAGLAAMPALQQRSGIALARPLLSVPSAQLKAWLKKKQIPFIDDPSNSDMRFTRNRIRADVLPAVETAIPHYREMFARAAQHAASAQAVLAEFAALDLSAAAQGSALRLPVLRAWSRERQANVLRHWLDAVHGEQATTAQTEELLNQIAHSQRHGAPRRMRIRVGHGVVARTGDLLRFSTEA